MDQELKLVKVKSRTGSRGDVHDTYSLVDVVTNTTLMTFKHYVEYSLGEVPVCYTIKAPASIVSDDEFDAGALAPA
jgi:hypothetical protein